MDLKDEEKAARAGNIRWQDRGPLGQKGTTVEFELLSAIAVVQPQVSHRSVASHICNVTSCHPTANNCNSSICVQFLHLGENGTTVECEFLSVIAVAQLQVSGKIDAGGTLIVTSGQPTANHLIRVQLLRVVFAGDVWRGQQYRVNSGRFANRGGTKQDWFAAFYKEKARVKGDKKQMAKWVSKNPKPS